MSILTKNTKKYLESIPASIGTKVSFIPFDLRLGKLYSYYSNNIKFNSDISKRIDYEFLIENFKNVISHFSTCNKFYNSIINSSNLNHDLKFDNLSSIPLINKRILKEVPLEERSCKTYGLDIYNTGGTSGLPLSFYVEKNFYAREWAHMHFMWGKIGYNPRYTKLTIRGKNIEKLYNYNFNQNEFLINSYHSFERNDYIKLYKQLKKYNVKFIHGYPSAIFNFLKNAVNDAPFLVDFFKKNIKGILFSSEYPLPIYRNYIEDLITNNTISWYGHTEGVILAGELYQKYEYTPFLSYGYAEAVEVDENFHLVGSCFHNFASPFIRYDTEDIIIPNINELGILESFLISEGRTGDFVIDKNGHNVSLTSIFFGRHHKLYEKNVEFIQAKQIMAGSLIIYIISKDIIYNIDELFDSSNLNLDISFKFESIPYKTSIGKIPLLIK